MKILSTIENTIAETSATIGPLLAPMPSAYFVWRAGTKHLEMEPWVAVVSALIIELLGLAATSQALTLYEYNTSKRKSDQGAPLVLAIALIAVYFFGVLALTVALEVFPQLSTVAPALFPILSLAGVGVLALRMDHRRRLAEIAQADAIKAQARQERKQEIDAKPAKSKPVAQPTRKDGAVLAPDMSTADKVLAIYARNPHATQAQVGKQLAISRQAVGEHLRKLEDDGKINRNGKVEVIA